MHYKTTAYSQIVLLVHELRLPCGTLLLKTTAYSIRSLQQSSRDDYYVHSLLNQLDDHNSEVFVLYFRDTGTVDVTTPHESESSAGYDDDESEPPLTDISILRSVGGEVFGCAFYK